MKSNSLIPLDSKAQLLVRLIRGSKIDFNTGCYLWNPQELNNTYGQISLLNIRKEIARTQPHRISAYIFLNFNLCDSKIQINHKRHCLNKNCWSPNHIYVGNQKENIQDLISIGTRNTRANMVTTHCPQGHIYNKSNTGYTLTMGKYCKTCKRIRNRLYRNKLKGL